LLIGGVIFWLIPQVIATDPVKKQVDFIILQQLDAAALFYTESEKGLEAIRKKQP